MHIKKLFSIVAMFAASFVSVNAHAAAHYDKHGNVGYDTAAECDAAIQAGTAKFYQSFTHKPPLIRAGEKSVQTATLKELGSQYAMGACDLGVGKKLGRDGVSKALQGKYIPFSPDMEVNVYTDKNGNAVRVSMKQCDNWFSGNAPRPVQFVTSTQAPAETVVATQPEVVSTTPAVVDAASKTNPAVFAGLAGVGAYAFGTVGVHSEKMEANGKQPSFYNRGIYNDKSTDVTGQVGVGLQFNPYVGGEVYFEDGKNKTYTATNGNVQNVNRLAWGARAVVGTNADAKIRGFLKAGVAAVHQDDFHPHFTVGAGALYQLTDTVALRADYDHYVKRSPRVYYNNMGFKNSNYVGLGLQYKFK